MAEGARPALGLSIGATNLAAVTADLAVIRKPVLTLYRQRPPEVGLPSENPRLDEQGLVIADFVDRVGNPIGIMAGDGSIHRSEALVADALRALAYAATGGRALPENIAVTYPAHWPSKSVDALGAAVSQVSEWSNRAHPLTLIPDAAAALFAMRANPGLPGRGTVAVCDFGGSGTTITLMDAAGDYRAVAPTVRHRDFSGDMIDQALLTAVMANMASTGPFDPFGTSAIGSLSRLRAACRSAKEQLSSSTVTTFTDDLTGVRGDIRLTKDELDEAIRESLNNFVALLDETLQRNGIRDLVAVVSVGGGANIPLVTTTLSGHLRVPVVTTPRPQLTAAVGGALKVMPGSADNGATAVIAAASVTAPAPAMATARAWPSKRKRTVTTSTTSTAQAVRAPGMMPALAWARTGGDPSTRPASNFEQPESPPPEPEKPVIRWYRRPTVAIAGTMVASVLVGTLLAIALGSDEKATTAGTSTTATSPRPPATSVVSQPPPATQQASPPPSTGTNPPATADPPTTIAPPAVPEGPAPQAPAPSAPPAPARWVPPVPRVPAIPRIPRIPGINEPIPGLSGIPTLASLIR